MESSEISGWLPDVNVWLSLCYDRHEHHQQAVNWLETVRIPVYFCRVTQMSLLRLLTNPRVVSSDILTPQDAIGVYRELRSDERVRYTHGPANIQANPGIVVFADGGFFRERRCMERCMAGGVRPGYSAASIRAISIRPIASSAGPIG